MSDKFELAAYLGNLMDILDAKEDVGLARTGWLATEYQKVFHELELIVKKEHEDAARKSDK